MASAPPMQKEWQPKLLAGAERLEQQLEKSGGPYVLYVNNYTHTHTLLHFFACTHITLSLVVTAAKTWVWLMCYWLLLLLVFLSSSTSAILPFLLKNSQGHCRCGFLSSSILLSMSLLSLSLLALSFSLAHFYLLVFWSCHSTRRVCESGSQIWRSLDLLQVCVYIWIRKHNTCILQSSSLLTHCLQTFTHPAHTYQHTKHIHSHHRERVPKLPPISINVLQHAVGRIRTAELLQQTKRKNFKPKTVLHAWKKLSKFHHYHGEYEEKVMFPLLEEKQGNATKPSHEQHEELEKLVVCFVWKERGSDRRATEEKWRTEKGVMYLHFECAAWHHWTVYCVRRREKEHWQSQPSTRPRLAEATREV